MMNSGVKVLIGDRDTLLPKRLADFLNERGFNCQLAHNGKDFRQILQKWVPQFVFTDLLMPDFNSYDVLNFIKSEPHLAKAGIQVLVTSSHNSTKNIKESIKAGATDYIIKPFKVEDILSRLVFHIQNKRQVVEMRADQERLDSGDFFLHLAELVLREATSGRDHRQILYNLTKMVALTLKAVRCSVIECNQDAMEGFVIASSDDPKVKDIRLDLNRYPEVIHVMNKERAVAIENMEVNPVLAKIKEMVKTISFNSMVVCPVFSDGVFFGVVSARLDAKDKSFHDREIRFVQLVAYTAGMVLEKIDYLPLEQKKAG